MGQWRHVDQPIDSVDSLFDTDTPQSPAELAASLAPPAAPGHFDELRGRASAIATKYEAQSQELVKAWGQFFEQLGLDGFTDLNRRTANLERQIRDNGVTYNVYADAERPAAAVVAGPVPADHLAAELAADRGRRAAARARARPRHGRRLRPAAIAGRRPAAARAGAGPPGLPARHARRAARRAAPTCTSPPSTWRADPTATGGWCRSARRRRPGLGYLLENRLAISRLFPKAFEDLHVQRLAATYRALVDGLQAHVPGRPADSHIALLTPGPYNETYFEHAYLARYLGLTLVEGSDLTVRDQRLYLKTLQGLEPVHGLLKRLDDEFLDPLELRADSRAGRAGPAAGDPRGQRAGGQHAGLGLSRIARPARLPAGAGARTCWAKNCNCRRLPTWWCGERAAMEAVLPQLGELRDQAHLPRRDPHALRCGAGAARCRAASSTNGPGRIVRERRRAHRAVLPAAVADADLEPQDRGRAPHRAALGACCACSRSATARSRGACCPAGWRGSPAPTQQIASMQRGGSSADTWVLTQAARSTAPPCCSTHAAPAIARAASQPPVTSRAAENLFWLGRYTERAENTIAAGAPHARLPERRRPVLAAAAGVAAATWRPRNALVLPDVPAASQARARVRALADRGAGRRQDGGQRRLQPALLRQARGLRGARAPVAGALEP